MSNPLENQLESVFMELLEFQFETLATFARHQSVTQRTLAKHIDKSQSAMTYARLFGLVEEKHKNMKVGIIATKFKGLVADWVEYLRDEMEVV